MKDSEKLGVRTPREYVYGRPGTPGNQKYKFWGSQGVSGPLFQAFPIFARSLSWKLTQPMEPSSPRGAAFAFVDV